MKNEKGSTLSSLPRCEQDLFAVPRASQMPYELKFEGMEKRVIGRARRTHKICAEKRTQDNNCFKRPGNRTLMQPGIN
jgi:hypothetical protein